MPDSTRTRINSDVWVALCALASGAFVLFSIPAQVSGESILAVADMGSSAFFPAIAGIFMLICGGVLLFKTVVAQGILVPVPDDPAAPTDFRRTLSVFALFLIYLFAIETLGMMVSSVALIAVMALILQYENKKFIVISAVVFPVLVYVLFERILRILLPHGVLF
ncbi:tripartite tricarboxylate transporter TctB family protein [Pelagibius sp. CAU 1746]|uniref:tripartite tricarboxylate transporter TctB family protein n=1 Tax=Pelagibius sp. CAU 1746 TaxID=3140370 RepID=UPI00325B2282